MKQKKGESGMNGGSTESAMPSCSTPTEASREPLVGLRHYTHGPGEVCLLDRDWQNRGDGLDPDRLAQ